MSNCGAKIIYLSKKCWQYSQLQSVLRSEHLKHICLFQAYAWKLCPDGGTRGKIMDSESEQLSNCLNLLLWTKVLDKNKRWHIIYSNYSWAVLLAFPFCGVVPVQQCQLKINFASKYKPFIINRLLWTDCLNRFQAHTMCLVYERVVC